MHSCINSCIRWWIDWLIDWLIDQFRNLLLGMFVCLFVCLSVCLLVGWFVRSFVCSKTGWLDCLFLCACVHSCVRPLINEWIHVFHSIQCFLSLGHWVLASEYKQNKRKGQAHEAWGRSDRRQFSGSLRTAAVRRPWGPKGATWRKSWERQRIDLRLVTTMAFDL